MHSPRLSRHLHLRIRADSSDTRSISSSCIEAIIKAETGDLGSGYIDYAKYQGLSPYTVERTDILPGNHGLALEAGLASVLRRLEGARGFFSGRCPGCAVQR